MYILYLIFFLCRDITEVSLTRYINTRRMWWLERTTSRNLPFGLLGRLKPQTPHSSCWVLKLCMLYDCEKLTFQCTKHLQTSAGCGEWTFPDEHLHDSWLYSDVFPYRSVGPMLLLRPVHQSSSKLFWPGSYWERRKLMTEGCDEYHAGKAGVSQHPSLPFLCW